MTHTNSARVTPASDGVASWYTPGLVDGFGDRLLMFDNTETDSLELLRFYPSLSAIAGFEDALHERVRQIGRIPDHAFPLIVAVERLEGDGALALVSTHIPGKRLSVFFDRPGPRRGLNPSFVTGIVTQMVQALTVLQSKGDDIAHGALTPDRVVVTTGGRVCIVEHVLGSALVHLRLSAAQLWREFGIVTIPDDAGRVQLDARTDVFQLGVIALEMLLGRRVTPQELKDRLPDLIDHWSVAMARVGLASDRLRVWLERALQIGEHPYATAADASAELRDVPAESAASAFDSLTGEVDDISSRRQQPARPAAVEPKVLAAAAASLPPVSVPASEAAETAVEPAAAAPLREVASSAPVAIVTPPPGAPAKPAPRHAAATVAPERRTAIRVPRMSPWIAAALGVVILIEGVVIAALVMKKPAAPASVESLAAAVTVESQSVPEAVESPAPVRLRTPIPDGEERVPVPAAPAAGSSRAAAAPAQDVVAAAANRQRSGGVRLVTPIELKVLQGDKVLGSSADGAIVATAGTHELEMVNTALGLKLRVPVTFRAGQITNVNVNIPPGRVSVNAQPWGEVAIDGKVIGETPLANLSVPIGEHEFVFRHPELGERRMNVTVRADGPTRVSTSFER